MAVLKVSSCGPKSLTRIVALVNKLVADIATLKTEVTDIRTKHNAAMVKLDADAGVTDTNYNALHAVSAITAATATDTLSTNQGV